MLECVRCKKTGKVRKYLSGKGGCEGFEVLAFLVFSVVIGSIIGVISYILLIKKLSFDYFGRIFYFFGAFSICSFIFHDSFENVLKEKEILFGNIINKPPVLIFIIFLSYINIKLGKRLILSDKIFVNLINIIYSILQGIFIVFIILIIIEVSNNTAQIKCPLCQGNKFIEERIFMKMKRCKDCSQNCGYKNDNSSNCCDCSHRGFCLPCLGKGYIFENY